MGSAVVYAVRTPILVSIAGIADDAVLTSLINGHEDYLEAIDDATREAVEDGAIERFLSVRDALRHIVFGDTKDPRDAGVYAEAYELMCAKASIGYFEDWVQFARAANGIAAIQRALKTQGVDIDLEQLFFSGAGIEIPDPEDGLSFGFWDQCTVQRNGKTLARLTGRKRWFRKPLDTETRQHAADILKWTNSASGREDIALIGVYRG